MLNYYNLNQPKTVASKHHGKLARIQSDRQKKSDHLSPLTKLNNVRVSSSNVVSLPPIKFISYEEALQSTMTTPAEKAALRLKLNGSTSNASLERKNIAASSSKILPFSNGMALDITTQSSHKWTKDQNKKLNDIYIESRKPLPNDNEVWKSHLRMIAIKFRAYHPERQLDDVINHLQNMIRFRKIKEPSETEYWNQFALTKINNISTSSKVNI